MKWSAVGTGAVGGAGFALPLLAIFYLLRQVAKLSFPPFDLFDWMARRLPGPVVTFGIDLMVSVLRLLPVGETSAAAKNAEQLLALGMFVLVCALAGAFLYAWLDRPSPLHPAYTGAALGGALGLCLGAVAASISRAGAGAGIGYFLGVVVLLAAWGAVLGWSFPRLLPRQPARPAGEASAAALVVEPISRRRFILRVGEATATITVLGAGLGALVADRRSRSAGAAAGVPWSERNALPNAADPVQPAPGTRPELTPVEDHYRIDINTTPPVLREEDWRLRLGGLVGRPLELTLGELRNDFPAMHQFVTLACISNRIAGSLTSTTRWTGVSAQRILARTELHPRATHLRIRSADGFYEILDLALVRADERVMLTYAWDGLPLPLRHGFPLRVYIPDRYGMKQPKWIESIEAIDRWEAGYWVRRGWDAQARMRATAVIDTIAADMMLVSADRTTLVPIGGIAHAGARGISRVEVRVDNGPWVAARLRHPLSPTTWVIWRYEWPFQEGDHTFTVRCFEGDGTPQVSAPGPVRPSGATGLHTEQQMF